MTHPVVNESKHILRRVLIGSATGVLGALIIYFLGYNRNTPKASEAEIKKNTIAAWKTYVNLENNMMVNIDSNTAKVNRSLITYKDRYHEKDLAIKEIRRQDSLALTQFKKNLQELKETKDIDKEFSILLGDRIAYLDEQIAFSMDYKTKFAALVLDSAMQDNLKNSRITEINTAFNNKMQNLTERMGRNIEDLAGSLSKKYEYSFSLIDFKFYPFYLNLKKTNNQPAKPEVAPSDPNKNEPVLPD